jgi:hypothetical protein
MDKHVLSGNYAVSDDNSVALPIVSGDSTTPINYATISNVAKASDLGKIVSIDKTGNGDTTGDTVVSNINNIYHNLKDVSGDVTNNITNINKLIASDDLNVKYDGTDKTKVTLAGNGGTTITNVKAAVLSSDSTEAVNGSQLYQTNQNVTNLKTTVDAGWVANAGGNDLNVTPTNRKLNFKAGSNVTLSSDVDTNTIEISATSSGGTDDNAVLYDGTDKTKVTLKGAGGTTITNVKAAVLSSDSTEAVNGSQLYQTNQNVTDLSSYVNKGLTFAGNTGSDAVSLDKTVSIVGGAKANGKIYSTTNVTTEESKDTNGNSTITVMTADNPNYSQINVTNNSGDTITITPTSIDMSNHKIINVAGPVNSCDVTNKEYVDNSIKNVNETAKKHNTTVAGHNITVTSKDNAEGGIEYTVATASEVSFDKVTVGTDATKQVIISDNGVSIGGKTYVSNSGLNANSQVITNVLAGVASTDAVNVSQLKSTVAGAATIVAAGTNTSVTSTKDKDTGATTYTVDLKPTITVGTGTSNDVTINGTDGTIKTGKVTITGGTTNTVTGLSNTTWDQNATYNSGRAATEEQLQAATKNAVAAAGENDIHIKASTADNPYKAADGTITMDLVTSGDKPTGQQIVIGDVASKKQQDINTTNIANGWTAQIDGTTVKTVNPTSNTLNFEAGENVTLTSDNGSIKIASAGDSSAVHYDKDSAGNVDKTKVTLGDGSTPTTISNLADGTVTQNSTEAVNGSQLYDTNMRIEDLSNGYYQIENQIGDLDTEVARVGANSAALSGLHPLEYDPEYKWDFAAAYGAYRSQHAIAIGAFYRPNENMLLNLATSLGNSNNMYTAGISFRLGAKYDHVSSTGRQAQAKQIAALQEENKAIREDNEAIKAENQEIKAKMDSLLKKLEKMNIKP